MRAATGSQWSSMSSGVTCALFGGLNTRRAAAFWISCNGFTTQAGVVETEAMWAVKVSWSSIMTPRFLAVLDGTRDKESILILMLWWMTCLAGKTISFVLARFS